MEIKTIRKTVKWLVVQCHEKIVIRAECFLIFFNGRGEGNLSDYLSVVLTNLLQRNYKMF